MVAVALPAACGHTSRRAAPPPTTTSSVVTVVTTTTVPFTAYRVKAGDTLTKIARQFRVSESSIVALNHIANPDVLAEGRTLRIPPPPPLTFTVKPHRGTVGQAFQLTLTGAPPNEPVTFEVHSPSGTFTGPQHIATADGTVTAAYQTAEGDAAGTYTVVARGTTGPIRNATFVVTPSTPPT